ncbi:MAG TPA: spherulation-specific family 4 protein [Ktedonobacterales bacterium]
MAQRIALPPYFDDAQSPEALRDKLGKLATGQERGVVAIAVFDDWNALTEVKPILQASGIQLFGRVSTNKGAVERDVCAAFIDDWFRAHSDLDGIFVDEGPPIDARAPEQPEPDWVWDYYGDDSGEGIYGHIKRKNHDAKVFLNCPGCRDAAVFDVCDIAEVVEQDCANYVVKAWWTGAHTPWWTQPRPGKAVAHVVRSCPDEWSMRVAVGLSKARGAQYVYVYDDGSALHPDLPAYWNAETAAVADTPTEPCQLIADVIPDITRAIDDLSARIDHATSEEEALLIQEVARLAEERAEVEVTLNECREG